MWSLIRKMFGSCVNKSKTTVAKVSGAGVSIGLVLFLHSDIKAEIKDKFSLAQENTSLKVAAILTKVEANKEQTQTQFEMVQKTIDLQVQTVNEKMQAIQQGQGQVLRALEKLDKRLYELNKKEGG